jgi:hypothetical protein
MFARFVVLLVVLLAVANAFHTNMRSMRGLVRSLEMAKKSVSSLGDADLKGKR